MVAISRRGKSGTDGPAERLLYADSAQEPFGGSRSIIVAEPALKPRRKGQDGTEPEMVERVVHASWGPAGELDGFTSRHAAELAQIDAYRRSTGDRPAIRVLTWGRPTPIHRPSMDRPSVPLDTGRPLEDIAGDYAARLAVMPGLAVARKKDGAHYTPATLVEALLDSALDPLIEEAQNLPTAVGRITALMALTFCDPACGSGAFVVAAARRIGRAVAVEDAGTLDVTGGEVRMATRAVIARLAHGVDLAEMAAELCKVVLWLESMDPDLPNLFLDDKIRVGNGLLGTTPALLAAGIPDAAFAVLVGDDPKVVAELRRRNATERDTEPEGVLF